MQEIDNQVNYITRQCDNNVCAFTLAKAGCVKHFQNNPWTQCFFIRLAVTADSNNCSPQKSGKKSTAFNLTLMKVKSFYLRCTKCDKIQKLYAI